MKKSARDRFRSNPASRAAWSGGLIASLLAAVGAPPGAVADPATRPPGVEALDYAFRFASAIKSDPKDRAKAQELAISELAQLGAFEEGVSRAEAVEGWRQGIAYADLGTALASRKRADEARALITRAEAIRSATKGWEGERIAAHIAQGLAVLGEVDRARVVATTLAAGDPGQYAGRAAATLAVGRAAGGDFAQAMQELAAIEGNNDLDASWWRFSGYLTLARREGLSPEQRLQAIDAARNSADSIGGLRRIEALGSIAEEYVRLKRRSRAREALAAADALLSEMAPGSPERGALLPDLARTWGRAGDGRRARRLLAEAEPLADGALVIDRPAIYAAIASGHQAIGVESEARRLFDRSLTTAAALQNARPRALAVAAICRQMGRDGKSLDDSTRGRLDALLAGLGDPW